VHQALLKARFGARTEADLQLLQHKDLSVGNLESSLPNKMKKMPRIEQLG